jgi:hypothetical protein
MSIYQTVATTPQLDERIHELAASIEGTVTGIFKGPLHCPTVFVYEESPERLALGLEYIRSMVQ